MRTKNVSWSLREGNESKKIHYLLSNLSKKVRCQQYDIFNNLFKPTKIDKVIDIGVSSVEELPDVNYFEKRYPYQSRLTIASIDDLVGLNKRYPRAKFQKIFPGKMLPFRNKTFDIAVSWATLEHVGSKQKQNEFLKEIFRVGKRVFITVPYRGCIYEPHSGLFIVHWLPRIWFSVICKLLRKEFWATENNLRSLWISELKEILPKDSKIKIIIFKTLFFFPSHLIIIKN